MTTIVVLAVPDSPTNMTGCLMDTMVSSSHVERTVSDVGTVIDENLPSAGGTYSGTSDAHARHLRSSTSKR